jgi:hypothetical protein
MADQAVRYPLSYKKKAGGNLIQPAFGVFMFFV